MTYPLNATTAAALALADNLEHMAALLEQATDFYYRWLPPGGVSGSVGAHVRHTLDHVAAVLDADDAAPLTYDHRRRNGPLEQSRLLGIRAVQSMALRLRATAGRLEDRPLVVRTIVQRGTAPVEVASSLARELVFVLQHTIHHQALIALLLNARGVTVPAQFGYAPSTPLRVAS